MPAALVVLSVVLMYCMARTAAFQRTIRTLGLLRSQESAAAECLSSERAIILLGVYVGKLNVTFLLGIAVYLITARSSAWYYGLLILVLCWVGSLLMAATPWLRLGMTEVMAALVADLERRREWYRMCKDASRLRTIEDLLL